MPNVKLPYIPQNITVHLGKPASDAANVQVPFVEYIKNVASSEIYPTWPESAIIANIYAQISFALNRIYLEWYRSRGYDFDITNSTQFDQAYKPGRDTFDNISKIVDDIFNNYMRKQGSIEPYAAKFCNGTTVKCEGLSQWGTVDLAKKGYTPYQILQNYYGKDIELVENAPVQAIVESYPGAPLRLGSSGNEVKLLQDQLNRISKNFPAIPKISSPDGTFGVETENAVKVFQQTFDLTPDGIVGKSTWYKIKSIYNNVKKLSELGSEGVKFGELTQIYPSILKEGDQGEEVKVIQYFLNIIAYSNPTIPSINIDGYYGTLTKQAVTAFQQSYGLTPDGIVGRDTWNKMQQIYNGVVELAGGYVPQSTKPYPGYALKKGMKGDNVTTFQTYLSTVAQNDPAIPKFEVTGTFDQPTYDAVIAFQKKYGMSPSGNVGALTWNIAAEEYSNIINPQEEIMP